MKALQGDPEKINLYGQQAGGMNLADSGQPGGQLGTNAEGDLSGGSGGVNSGEGVKQSNDVASNAAVAANVGRVKAPADVGNLRKSVDDTGMRLQDEANKYVTASTGANALSEEDKINLRTAVDPDYARGTEPNPYANDVQIGGPGQQPKNTLDYWTGLKPTSVKSVDPFKTSTTTTNGTIESLATDAGVQNLLRRSGGAEYNAGEAAFDQALLSRDLGFQQQREDLLGSYGNLQKTASEIGDKTTQRAQDSANTAYGQYLGNLKTTLQGWEGDYADKGRAREKEIEDAAQKQLFDLKAGSSKTAEDIAKQMRESPDAAAYKDFVSTSGFDYGDYFNETFNPEQYAWQDYLGENEAGTFNNIMGLLGKKDTFKTGAKAGGLSGSDLGSFDSERFRTDLGSRAQTEMARAQEAAAAKAAEDKAAAEAAAAEAERAAIAAGTGATYQGSSETPMEHYYQGQPSPWVAPGGDFRQDMFQQAQDPNQFGQTLSQLTNPLKGMESMIPEKAGIKDTAKKFLKKSPKFW